MARPRPRILREWPRNQQDVEEILSARAITYLTFQGRPISIRITNRLTGRRQYKRTSSTNPGFVRLLADRLNDQYQCGDFSCLTLGETHDPTQN